MPGIWDHLATEIITAGPRRVELKPHAPSGAVLHELRVPHAPLLSTDEPPLDDDLGILLGDGSRLTPDVLLGDGFRFVWSEKTDRYEWEKV